MLKNAITSAIAALSLTAGAPAFAQGHDQRDERGSAQHWQRGGQSQRWQDQRADERGGQSQRWQDQRADERGAGPDHAYRRGQRLPAQYRSRQYVVDDWRGHQLSAPPRGYHWVQTGGDYVLVAIATGLIVQLLLSH